jgi:hypothetical protein
MIQDTEIPGSRAQATNEWENEGGSVKPTASSALPEGVTSVTVTQYRVGPYTYSSLDDAMAEHRRRQKI